MSAVDDTIRRALRAAADTVEPISDTDLAAALRARRDRALLGAPGRIRDVRHARPGWTWLVAALVVAVVGLAVTVRWANQPDGRRRSTIDQVRAGPDPGPVDAFGGLAPGWHALDTGAVPASTAASLAWTGSELGVAVPGAVHLYDPVELRWTRLELPAGLGAADTSMAWTGEDLVVVTEGGDQGAPARSAAWNPEAQRWRDLGPVPVAPPVTAAVGLVGGSGALSGPDGNLSLVWTGTRLLDLSHGAVLDPVTGTWSVLALPGDLVPYTALLYTTPVWTGREVVLAAWSTGPGLAWNRDGTTFREVPGMPPELFGPHDVIPDATATRLGSEVLVQADLLEVTAADPSVDPSDDPGSTAAAAVLDPVSGTWTAFEATAAIAGEPWCWPRSVTLGTDTVVASTRCPEGVPSVLADGTWTSIPPDAAVLPCCAGTWTTAGDALVVWESDTDTTNNPEAPYVRARVWVAPPTR